MQLNHSSFAPENSHFKLLSQAEAAKLLGLAPETLSVWRCTKRYNLPYIKVGRLVKYREADLMAFVESRRISRSHE